MREIEVKAKLHDLNAFLCAAHNLGIEFGSPIIQDDTVFENNVWHDHPDYNIFRIRIQAGSSILTMKYHASTRSQDKYEYETVVGDPDQTIKMLRRLGYNPGVRIVKTRRIAHYGDLELSLDDVEWLGTFVEIEKLTDSDVDIDRIQGDLWEVLARLGAMPEDRVHKGYDILMHERLASQKSVSE